jgi:hypothetical protein
MTENVKTPEQIAAEAAAAAQAAAEAAAIAKAAKDAKAAEAKAAKEAKAAEAKAAKEAKAAAAAEAKAAKEKEKAEKAAAKLAAKPVKIEMPMQNGVRRPKPEGLCGQAWALADDLSREIGGPVPIAKLLEAAKAKGLNEGNVRAEYASWRKFNGVSGRIVAAPVVAASVVPAVPGAEVPRVPAE